MSRNLAKFTQLYSEFEPYGVSTPHKIYEMARADTKKYKNKSKCNVHAVETKNSMGSKPILSRFHNINIDPIGQIVRVIKEIEKTSNENSGIIYGFFGGAVISQSDYAINHGFDAMKVSRAITKGKKITMQTYFSRVK